MFAENVASDYGLVYEQLKGFCYSLLCCCFFAPLNMNNDNKNIVKSVRGDTESIGRIMGMILVQLKAGG